MESRPSGGEAHRLLHKQPRFRTFPSCPQISELIWDSPASNVGGGRHDGSMNTAPADLIETLTGLDSTLGDTVHESLSADAVRSLSDTELLELTRVTEALGRRVDALRITTAAEVDDRSRTELGEERLSARSGCSTAADLLCRVTGIASATARARIRQGRAVAVRTTLTGQPLPARFPTVREALIDGGIGGDSITAITSILNPIADRTDPAQWAAAEYELTAAATGNSTDQAPACTADETRIQAKVWELVLDPDGKLPDDERAARKRGIVLGRERDNIVPIRGALLPEVAAQLIKLNDAHLNPRVEDRTTPETSAGVSFHETSDADTLGAAEIPADTRTRAQKLHDVFATILSVAARSAETPTLGGLPPTVLITIPADELHSKNGVGFIDGTDCTVPAFVARQAACCGGIQHMIIDDDGRIIELGSPNRTFTAQQRRAIIARDGGCIIPGCHMPATWCEIHHVIPHSKGGPTHTDNGVPLCWWHHPHHRNQRMANPHGRRPPPGASTTQPRPHRHLATHPRVPPPSPQHTPPTAQQQQNESTRHRTDETHVDRAAQTRSEELTPK
ncbi:DUF222 domain-containing protein [Microbacterium horticulturae]|uniref:DUF222 domain-containing protein n=1 Tax=Microbacterium horticulturae TaxID=3028316 RepID=A0ABY8C4M6_9MICO|nr:HNH endonuclease signature motif containing protein [Microbacterium sp. KACC 23027]WEG09793.1 DUF222 domain-containing protein [Microbacterium sp. KACC 23027]